MTEVVNERELLNALIHHADSIDWLGVAAVFTADAESGEYVAKAIRLIPEGTAACSQFRNAVLKSIPNAKRIHYHWLVKALACLLQPDCSGNVITPSMIRSVSRMKRNRYVH